MRRLLIAAAALAVAVVAGGGYYVTRLAPPSVHIGGPFQLVDQDGRAFTERDLKGRPSAIFFGFTQCPEICPTTLANMTAWLEALGPAGERLNVVFVSIDPGRDTPARLKLYLSAFDPRIRGLTGPDDAVARIAREYHVYYRKVPLPGGGYTMDHSAAIYLMDAQGRFVEPLAYGSPPRQALDALKRLTRT